MGMEEEPPRAGAKGLGCRRGPCGCGAPASWALLEDGSSALEGLRADTGGHIRGWGL